MLELPQGNELILSLGDWQQAKRFMYCAWVTNNWYKTVHENDNHYHILALVACQ